MSGNQEHFSDRLGIPWVRLCVHSRQQRHGSLELLAMATLLGSVSIMNILSVMSKTWSGFAFILPTILLTGQKMNSIHTYRRGVIHDALEAHRRADRV